MNAVADTTLASDQKPAAAAAGGADAHAEPGGALSVATRAFGWLNLTMLTVFLVNNVLTFGLDWPGADAALSGEGGVLAVLQLGAYAVVALLTLGYVISTSSRSLRLDAKVTHDANAFLIRAAFWSVLLIGVVDAAISFLRVEGLLEAVVGPEMTTNLGRPQYRGPMVHVPLMAVGLLIASMTRTLGFIWLATMIVLAELLIVITRFVFSYEQAFMGDLVRFWYAALFLFASAYTLFEDGHVRVDVFYAGFSPQGKGMVNAIGSILLGITLCWTIIALGMGGKAAIVNSPVMNFEVSQSGFGMYIKYLMAGFLGLFAVSMMIQFVSYLMEATADYRNEAGRREVSGETAH